MKKNDLHIALIQSLVGGSDRILPLGLLCLASYIKEHNFEPIIIDLNNCFKREELTAHSVNEIAKKILINQPDVLGFNVMSTSFPLIILVAQECKRMAPQIPIILGGPEVSFDEIDVLKTFEQIDLIVRGEGEITLVEVLRAIKQKGSFADILGITYRRNGRIINNPDRPLIKNLDELPFLDFSLLQNLDNYQEKYIEAGRGCPFRCTFCSTCKMWRRNFRIKSPERLAQELKSAYALIKKNEDSFIHIIHDHFLTSRRVINNFLSLVSNKGIPWRCSSRLDALDDNLIKKLKKAGCQYIFLGIESGSPETQNKIEKRLPLSVLPQIVESLGQNDIQATLSFIIGFPEENEIQINETLEVALKTRLTLRPPDIKINFFTFLKGSKLYEKYKNDLEEDISWQADVFPPTINIPAERSLIKKHPKIFPSFFYLKRKDFPPKFLRKIHILFSFLAEFFPCTSLFLLRHFSVTPLEIGRKMIAFFESAGSDWILFCDLEAYFNYYAAFLKKFLDEISSPEAKAIFRHEVHFQKCSFMEVEAIQPGESLGLNSRPVIMKHVKTKTYNYDIPNLIDHLKSDKQILKVKSYLAYVSGSTPQAVSLSSLAYYLLQFCNGKSSVREIFNQCLNEADRNRRGEEVIMRNLQFLWDHGIISTV